MGPSPKSDRGLWIAGLAGLLGLVFAPSSTALGCVLLLPTAMAWIADTDPARPTARVVLLFGLTAACAPFDAVWQVGPRPMSDVALSTDIRTIAIAWAAQAGGWLLTQVLAVLISAWAGAQADRQVAAFEKTKAELIDEWGDPS